jgi:hypothetical protein
MPRPKTYCTVAGCVRQNWARGYCSIHYVRFNRYGTPTGGRSPNGTPLATRLVERSEVVPSGCWEWTGSRSPDGYGKIYDATVGRPNHVHVVSYREFKGPIVKGLQIDHLCRNRCCCNPDHLEQVTPSVNVQRALAAKRAG